MEKPFESVTFFNLTLKDLIGCFISVKGVIVDFFNVKDHDFRQCSRVYVVPCGWRACVM